MASGTKRLSRPQPGCSQLSRKRGWGIYQTENAATFTSENLARFDAVVFNNASGDLFLPAQRKALRDWLEGGGGIVGIHAARDSSHAGWAWYTKEVIGARFTQHTMSPQFQEARVTIQDTAHFATQGLPGAWRRTEEWYSFEASPRKAGAHVLLSVDETSYTPEGMFGKDLRMGDHPVAWTRCLGPAAVIGGRAIYTAFGHRAEAFAEPQTRVLLANATAWAMRLEGEECGGAAERQPR